MGHEQESRKSEMAKSLEDQGHSKIAGAMYSVETGVVKFIS